MILLKIVKVKSQTEVRYNIIFKNLISGVCKELLQINKKTDTVKNSKEIGTSTSNE